MTATAAASVTFDFAFVFLRPLTRSMTWSRTPAAEALDLPHTRWNTTVPERQRHLHDRAGYRTPARACAQAGCGN